jgi:hypothetical protein
MQTFSALLELAIRVIACVRVRMKSVMEEVHTSVLVAMNLDKVATMDSTGNVDTVTVMMDFVNVNLKSRSVGVKAFQIVRDVFQLEKNVLMICRAFLASVKTALMSTVVVRNFSRMENTVLLTFNVNPRCATLVIACVQVRWTNAMEEAMKDALDVSSRENGALRTGNVQMAFATQGIVNVALKNRSVVVTVS